MQEQLREILAKLPTAAAALVAPEGQTIAAVEASPSVVEATRDAYLSLAPTLARPLRTESHNAVALF